MTFGSCYIFFFQTRFWLVKLKGLPAPDDTGNSEITSYHDFKKKLLNETYVFHIWILDCVYRRTEAKIRKKITLVPQAKGDRLLCSDHENNTQHSNDCLVALAV